MSNKLEELKEYILKLEKEFIDNKKDRKIIINMILKKIEELDLNEIEKTNTY